MFGLPPAAWVIILTTAATYVALLSVAVFACAIVLQARTDAAFRDQPITAPAPASAAPQRAP